MDLVLNHDQRLDQLARDVRDGLTGSPKTLPSKYFYDAHGSDLFDQITRLPEYYPTRREREILADNAARIARLSGAETLIELGSGTSDKTRLLLDALQAAGSLRRFVPFDVDPAVLHSAARALSTEYPHLQVSPIVGDFEADLDRLPAGSRRLLAFLGSTIGNLVPAERADFLGSVRAVLDVGDALLLGTDLVKDPDRLVAAYDDAAGVTAAFNKNVLAVLNRDLAADFDLAGFDHVAVWDREQEWIEMRLRSRSRQRVRIASCELTVEFAEGDEIRTEISAKFRLEGIRAELAAAGLRADQIWTDRAGDFAVSLALPV
ncbi:L-histidine N(alpha)-methyltransferase [Microlunatus soli]|uniref:Histidine N-alpha-methyltransferase n=1 Tax=Microlunatus soli TaxID=630515 RepID=A0A1H1NDD8_9ACTN|nr:L-histidine N(alpha)-methyltransferase [Microlunatus soli]SDR96962.1 L-histidine Nalpha-methyltransferase [Microlunatus soli]